MGKSKMWEANVTFKREDREGIVPVGTYLSDAAGRLGVRSEHKCVPFENIHFCRVSVLEGATFLSGRTSAEDSVFAEQPGDENDRLACQVKIVKPGEITIMTTETKEEIAEERSEAAVKEYTKEFAELPLEKKMAQLVQLEAIALGETVSFIMNSPYLIFDKIVDVMAEFGMKKEAEGKRSTRPEEHSGGETESDPVDSVNVPVPAEEPDEKNEEAEPET